MLGYVGQLVIVGTGWYSSTADYFASERCGIDNPGHVVERDGTVVEREGNKNVVALANAGVVVQRGNRWYPAIMGADGRWAPIDGAPAVRVPYEFCPCKLYHGARFYEMVGSKQATALYHLLKGLLSELGISFPYDPQLGAVCRRAQKGGSGIYFASSFDKNRSDIHPQVELINIIKSLAS